MIQTILDIVRCEGHAIIGGDYARLNEAPFAGYTLATSPNGSTVIALKLAPEALSELPASHAHVDLFLLNANARLGAHYHRHASAHIHIVAGRAVAEVDGVAIEAAPGDQAFFPAGSVHDVHAGHEAVLFASFQDNPILQPDGSVDYYAVD